MTSDAKYKRSLDALRRQVETGQVAGEFEQRANIQDETARQKKLQNDDAEQDIALKRKTLNRLYWLLVAETVIIFSFSLLQATGWLGFWLEEWSFKLLTTVTITQVTVMLFVAVSYLFPKRKN